MPHFKWFRWKVVIASIPPLEIESGFSWFWGLCFCLSSKQIGLSMSLTRPRPRPNLDPFKTPRSRLYRFTAIISMFKPQLQLFQRYWPYSSVCKISAYINSGRVQFAGFPPLNQVLCFFLSWVKSTGRVLTPKTQRAFELFLLNTHHTNFLWGYSNDGRDLVIHTSF